MAILNYASPNTGLLSGAIGWINLGTGSNIVTINSGGSLTNQSATLRDGSVLRFNMSLVNVSGEALFYQNMNQVTFAGGFGFQGFTGINAPVCIGNPNSLTQNTTNNRLTISNISLVDSSGVTVPNFYFYAVEANISGSVESYVFSTNGSNWSLFTNVGTGDSPTVSGTGTKTVTYQGTSGAWYSPMIVTVNPTSITWSYIVSSSGVGASGSVAFGVSVNKVNLRQNIANRMYSSDQFALNVDGSISSTTTTYGNSTGLQSVSSYIFPTTVGTVTLSNSMSPTSFSPLLSYVSTIALSNITPGGTVFPASMTLPARITLANGDIVYATITSTGVYPAESIINTKISPSFATLNDVLTYTIAYNNLGYTLTNVVLRDTIPSGTTFVPNSLKFNGSSISGSPLPPSGVSLPTIPLGLNTITFNVTIDTIPTINPISNISSTSFDYKLTPGTVSASINSNTAFTRINYGSATSSKLVNKNFAALNEIITYSIPITNNGNLTTSNVVLIDTIPSVTSFVIGSLVQDGVTLPGSTISSGVTLNNIGPGVTSTVAFGVVVNGLPTTNPMPNKASTFVTYTIDPSISRTSTLVTDTNTVSTQINYASFAGITKIVDKTSSYLGDTLTYTVVVPNSGNVTAVNAIFVDTTPNGMSFVPNSVTVDGTTLSGINPANGIPLPDIGPGSVLTITFKGLLLK